MPPAHLPVMQHATLPSLSTQQPGRTIWETCQHRRAWGHSAAVRKAARTQVLLQWELTQLPWLPSQEVPGFTH